MKLLLVHSDNVPVSVHDAVRNLGNAETFRITQSDLLEHNYSFDRHADRWLIGKLTDRSYDLIVLPYTLSETDYLELSGLRLGIHIRLSPELGHHKVPILFIGSETPAQIAKLTPLGNFLFTSGVYTTLDFMEKEIASRLRELCVGDRKLSDEQFQRAIEIIDVAPAANYDSHHALDNDLALVSWSEAIGCQDSITEVRENLRAGLYFKHQRIRTQRVVLANGGSLMQPRKLSNTGNIVLIDDEAEKGWCTFYRTLLNAEVQSYPGPFKNQNKDALIPQVIDFIKSEDADVVLLDLRLHDDDFHDGVHPSEFSGVKVLNGIKEWNRGVRVVVTTASNGIHSFREVMRLADDYVIKDGKSNPHEVCTQIVKTVDNALENAARLKMWSDTFQRIITNSNASEDYSTKFKRELSSSLEACFKLLEESIDRKELRSPSFLQIYHIIERLLGQEKVLQTAGDLIYVNQDALLAELLETNPKSNRTNKYKSAIKFNRENKSTYTREESEYVGVLDTNYRMSAVLIFRYGLETSDSQNWPIIRDQRNTKCAHQGISVTLDELGELIDFLDFLFNPNSIKKRDKGEGLDDSPRMQAGLDSLVAKFNSKS